MNISEALRKIKKIKGELAIHQARLTSSVSWTDSNKPTYSYEDTFNSIKSLSEELVELESKVAEKNATIKVMLKDKQVSLCNLIKRAQEVKSRITLISSLVIRNEILVTKDRFYSNEEDKYITEKIVVQYQSAITEVQKDRIIQELKDEFELLNTMLEDANHKTVL
jgi:hypothetical protein